MVGYAVMDAHGYVAIPAPWRVRILVDLRVETRVKIIALLVAMQQPRVCFNE